MANTLIDSVRAIENLIADLNKWQYPFEERLRSLEM